MATRRGMMALPWLLALAALMVVLGVSGAFQVGSSRRALEEIHARRVLDLAVASALEEASAMLENALPPQPPPVAGQARTGFTLPTSSILRTTPADFAADGVTLEPIAIAWSGFTRDERAVPQGSLVREYGILELTVKVAMKTSGPAVTRTVRARRYGALEPRRGDAGVRFRVYPHDLMLAVNG